MENHFVLIAHQIGTQSTKTRVQHKETHETTVVQKIILQKSDEGNEQSEAKKRA